MGLSKTSDPLGGAIFLPQCFNINNLGRGPLDKGIYQILKPWAFLFQTRRFLKLFLYESSVKEASPRAVASFDTMAIS